MDIAYILYCIAQFEIGITLIVKYLQTIMYNNWLNRICEQIYLEIYIYLCDNKKPCCKDY
jgi:hypothetical protein